MEKRISFEIHGEQYVLFVEGVLKKKYRIVKSGNCEDCSQHKERINHVLAGALTVLYEKKDISEEHRRAAGT